MRFVFALLIATATAAPCLAQEPVGCDKFKWPLDKERATLNGTDLPRLSSGTHVSFPIPFATALTLVPWGDAKLPASPERPPKSPSSFAGFLEVRAPARPGSYKITLSDAAWIDVMQRGKAVRSTAFSGATGCEGVRKSVKFDLAAAPFTVEISGAAAADIRLTVSGD